MSHQLVSEYAFLRDSGSCRHLFSIYLFFKCHILAGGNTVAEGCKTIVVASNKSLLKNIPGSLQVEFHLIMFSLVSIT
jgi:hypothetical protein